MKNLNRMFYCVTRAADGSYDLSLEGGDTLLLDFFGRTEEDDARWQRIGEALDRSAYFSKLPVKCHVEGWKRPFEHVLLDLIGAVQRMPSIKAYRALGVLGDDREWFLARAASGIRAAIAQALGSLRQQPGFIDDIGLHARLNREIAKHGSQAAAARAWGLSRQELHAALSGTRPVPPRILSAIGLRRVGQRSLYREV